VHCLLLCQTKLPLANLCTLAAATTSAAAAAADDDDG